MFGKVVMSEKLRVNVDGLWGALWADECGAPLIWGWGSDTELMETVVAVCRQLPDLGDYDANITVLCIMFRAVLETRGVDVETDIRYVSYFEMKAMKDAGMM